MGRRRRPGAAKVPAPVASRLVPVSPAWSGTVSVPGTNCKHFYTANISTQHFHSLSSSVSPTRHCLERDCFRARNKLQASLYCKHFYTASISIHFSTRHGLERDCFRAGLRRRVHRGRLVAAAPTLESPPATLANSSEAGGKPCYVLVGPFPSPFVPPSPSPSRPLPNFHAPPCLGIVYNVCIRCVILCM